jgi:hypothetical protein
MATTKTTTDNIGNSVGTIQADPADTIGPVVDYQVSYETTAADRAELAEADVLEVNVDVPNACTAARSSLKRLAELRPRMQDLPVELAQIDKVGVYAEALSFAHALYAIEAAPPAGMQELYDSLLRTRGLLRLDASNLAARGFIKEESIAGLKGDSGHENVAYDVLSLTAMHAAASSKSAGRSTVSAADLEQARKDASAFLNLLGLREQQLKTRSALNEQRRRAFTLLITAYDEARRAASFLQWKQESDKQLPSLYAARGAGRPKQGATPQVSDLAATTAAASAGTAGTAAGTNATQGATANTAPVALGVRGGSPFPSTNER